MSDTRKSTIEHEKEIDTSPITEDEMLKAVKSCELWDALRKFANKDVTRIARIIHEEGPKTLGELRDETELTTNQVNHTLIDMRNVDLVRKIGKRYYLTKYGAVLLNALDEVRKGVTSIPEDLLFKPIPAGKRYEEEISDTYSDSEAENARGALMIV